MAFKTGQIWTYNKDDHSFTILKIEDFGDTICVHIRINEPCVIQHMPISISSLLISAIRLVSEDNLIPDFTEGYCSWKDNNGGIFTSSIDDATKAIYSTYQASSIR